MLLTAIAVGICFLHRSFPENRSGQIRLAVSKPRCEKISKFLNFVLRDHMDGIGIELDSSGWADASELPRAKDYENRKQVSSLKGKKNPLIQARKTIAVFIIRTPRFGNNQRTSCPLVNEVGR